MFRLRSPALVKARGNPPPLNMDDLREHTGSETDIAPSQLRRLRAQNPKSKEHLDARLEGVLFYGVVHILVVRTTQRQRQSQLDHQSQRQRQAQWQRNPNCTTRYRRWFRVSLVVVHTCGLQPARIFSITSTTPGPC